MNIIDAVKKLESGEARGISCNGGRTGIFLMNDETFTDLSRCNLTLNIPSILSDEWEIVTQRTSWVGGLK